MQDELLEAESPYEDEEDDYVGKQESVDDEEPMLPPESPKYVLFGEYPQTIKAEDVWINEATIDSRGYYEADDGAYYAALNAQPYSTRYLYSNIEYAVQEYMTEVVEEEEKVLFFKKKVRREISVPIPSYFKVEPIRWRVLCESGTRQLLLAENILVARAFGKDKSYRRSELRDWLGKEFYMVAFSDEEKARIITTMVDNGVETTGYSRSTVGVDDRDTCDNVFIPSHSDVINTQYGFSINSTDTFDSKRHKKVTDYAIASGTMMYEGVGSSWYKDGEWWLRTPNKEYDTLVQTVSSYGKVNAASVTDNSIGVVPMIMIKRSDDE